MSPALASSLGALAGGGALRLLDTGTQEISDGNNFLACAPSTVAGLTVVSLVSMRTRHCPPAGPESAGQLQDDFTAARSRNRVISRVSLVEYSTGTLKYHTVLLL